MNLFSSNTSRYSDRRGSLRHYLRRPLQAELVYGRQRLALESGCIGDLSDEGIGLRAARPMKMVPGTLITVAAPQNDKVLTITGEIASIHDGIYLGIRVAECDRNPLADILGGGLDSATVSTPQDGLARLAGTVSMSARHPIHWAIKAGATRLNMAGVTAIDSAGISLLLLVNERTGVTIERCSAHICELLKLCETSALCAANCMNAPRRNGLRFAGR